MEMLRSDLMGCDGMNGGHWRVHADVVANA